MAMLIPQDPNRPKPRLYVASVLAPFYSKVHTLLTGQSRDVPERVQKGC